MARAAEREFIAPSAISRRIADIEAIVGLPLIQRHQRGITVTPVGETVRRYAERILGTIESLGAELSQFHEGARGSVRIAANLSAIVQFLPEDLAAFGRVFSAVDVELDEQHSNEVLARVGERAVDIGICNAVPGIEAFTMVPYRRDRLAVILPAAHPLAARTGEIAFSACVGETLVGLQGNSALTQLLHQQASTVGASLRIKIRVSSLDALCRMAHAGLGIAIAPEQVGQLYVGKLDVVVRPLTDEWAHRQLWLVYPGQDPLNAAAATLLNFLAQKA
ncbi:LysR family transcriptional regulator [Pandoraea nosoerga]|uniref:LysR family transcriptional regulator n=2 Tax=Burkholderiaceae TaxID=119060 RepID=A0A5E4U0W8_9BURK|nr:LysR family transcriptional regulator [Pandoraea nosoerga]